MPITPTPKIWMNGDLVDWDDARIHVGTHTLHYGTGVFEGIRAYETSQGPAVFRLSDHIVRLHNSAKILGMSIPYTVDELVEATKATVASTGPRHDHNIMPPAAKTTGNYVNSSLAKVEALKAGYDEAIMLAGNGLIAECSGENVFVSRNGI